MAKSHKGNRKRNHFGKGSPRDINRDEIEDEELRRDAALTDLKRLIEDTENHFVYCTEPKDIFGKSLLMDPENLAKYRNLGKNFLNHVRDLYDINNVDFPVVLRYLGNPEFDKNITCDRELLKKYGMVNKPGRFLAGVYFCIADATKGNLWSRIRKK